MRYFISILELKLDEIPSSSVVNSLVNETVKTKSNISNPIITDDGSISSSTVHNSTYSPKILQNSPLKDASNDHDSNMENQSVKPSSITDKQTNNDRLQQEQSTITSKLLTPTNIFPTMNALKRNRLSTLHKSDFSTNLGNQIMGNTFS
jgi:hypothetical protein